MKNAIKHFVSCTRVLPALTKIILVSQKERSLPSSAEHFSASSSLALKASFKQVATSDQIGSRPPLHVHYKHSSLTSPTHNVMMLGSVIT